MRNNKNDQKRYYLIFITAFLIIVIINKPIYRIAIINKMLQASGISSHNKLNADYLIFISQLRPCDKRDHQVQFIIQGRDGKLCPRCYLDRENLLQVQCYHTCPQDKKKMNQPSISKNEYSRNFNLKREAINNIIKTKEERFDKQSVMIRKQRKEEFQLVQKKVNKQQDAKASELHILRRQLHNLQNQRQTKNTIFNTIKKEKQFMELKYLLIEQKVKQLEQEQLLNQLSPDRMNLLKKKQKNYENDLKNTFKNNRASSTKKLSKTNQGGKQKSAFQSYPLFQSLYQEILYQKLVQKIQQQNQKQKRLDKLQNQIKKLEDKNDLLEKHLNAVKIQNQNIIAQSIAKQKQLVQKLQQAKIQKDNLNFKLSNKSKFRLCILKVKSQLMEMRKYCKNLKNQVSEFNDSFKILKSSSTNLLADKVKELNQKCLQNEQIKNKLIGTFRSIKRNIEKQKQQEQIFLRQCQKCLKDLKIDI